MGNNLNSHSNSNGSAKTKTTSAAAATTTTETAAVKVDPYQIISMESMMDDIGQSSLSISQSSSRSSLTSATSSMLMGRHRPSNASQITQTARYQMISQCQGGGGNFVPGPKPPPKPPKRHPAPLPPLPSQQAQVDMQGVIRRFPRSNSSSSSTSSYHHPHHNHAHNHHHHHHRALQHGPSSSTSSSASSESSCCDKSISSSLSSSELSSESSSLSCSFAIGPNTAKQKPPLLAPPQPHLPPPISIKTHPSYIKSISSSSSTSLSPNSVIDHHHQDHHQYHYDQIVRSSSIVVDYFDSQRNLEQKQKQQQKKQQQENPKIRSVVKPRQMAKDNDNSKRKFVFPAARTGKPVARSTPPVPLPRSKSFHQILRPTPNGQILASNGTIRGHASSSSANNNNNKRSAIVNKTTTTLAATVATSTTTTPTTTEFSENSSNDISRHVRQTNSPKPTTKLESMFANHQSQSQSQLQSQHQSRLSQSETNLNREIIIDSPTPALLPPPVSPPSSSVSQFQFDLRGHQRHLSSDVDSENTTTNGEVITILSKHQNRQRNPPLKPGSTVSSVSNGSTCNSFEYSTPANHKMVMDSLNNARQMAAAAASAAAAAVTASPKAQQRRSIKAKQAGSSATDGSSSSSSSSSSDASPAVNQSQQTGTNSSNTGTGGGFKCGSVAAKIQRVKQQQQQQQLNYSRQSSASPSAETLGFRALASDPGSNPQFGSCHDLSTVISLENGAEPSTGDEQNFYENYQPQPTQKPSVKNWARSKFGGAIGNEKSCKIKRSVSNFDGSSVLYHNSAAAAAIGSNNRPQPAQRTARQMLTSADDFAAATSATTDLRNPWKLQQPNFELKKPKSPKLTDWNSAQYLSFEFLNERITSRLRQEFKTVGATSGDDQDNDQLNSSSSTTISSTNSSKRPDSAYMTARSDILQSSGDSSATPTSTIAAPPQQQIANRRFFYSKKISSSETSLNQQRSKANKKGISSEESSTTVAPSKGAKLNKRKSFKKLIEHYFPGNNNNNNTNNNKTSSGSSNGSSNDDDNAIYVGQTMTIGEFDENFILKRNTPNAGLVDGIVEKIENRFKQNLKEYLDNGTFYVGRRKASGASSSAKKSNSNVNSKYRSNSNVAMISSRFNCGDNLQSGHSINGAKANQSKATASNAKAPAKIEANQSLIDKQFALFDALFDENYLDSNHLDLDLEFLNLHSHSRTTTTQRNQNLENRMEPPKPLRRHSQSTQNLTNSEQFLDRNSMESNGNRKEEDEGEEQQQIEFESIESNQLYQNLIGRRGSDDTSDTERLSCASKHNSEDNDDGGADSGADSGGAAGNRKNGSNCLYWTPLNDLSSDDEDGESIDFNLDELGRLTNNSNEQMFGDNFYLHSRTKLYSGGGAGGRGGADKQKHTQNEFSLDESIIDNNSPVEDMIDIDLEDFIGNIEDNNDPYRYGHGNGSGGSHNPGSEVSSESSESNDSLQPLSSDGDQHQKSQRRQQFHNNNHDDNFQLMSRKKTGLGTALISGLGSEPQPQHVAIGPATPPQLPNEPCFTLSNQLKTLLQNSNRFKSQQQNYFFY